MNSVHMNFHFLLGNDALKDIGKFLGLFNIFKGKFLGLFSIFKVNFYIVLY